MAATVDDEQRRAAEATAEAIRAKCDGLAHGAANLEMTN